MKRVMSIILLIMVTVTGAAISAYADTGESYTVNVSGTFNYSSGQEMIEYINEERAAQGADALELDSQLTDAAMQRAAEIAYYCEHIRPDGTYFNTVCGRAYGENIAGGNSTASGTFTQWMNSDGHRANMMSTNYTKIGIGHFTHNGVDFWVQLFGIDSKDFSETRTEIVEGTASVTVENSLYPLVLYKGLLDDGTALELAKGDSWQPSVTIVNGGWESVTCSVDLDSFSWSSSDESVATVDENGIITGKAYGNAVITGTAKTGSITPFVINVEVGTKTVDPGDLTGKTTIDISTWDKTGYSSTSAWLQDAITVQYKGKTLTYWDDYYISGAYGDGTSIIQLTIQYIGDYSGSEKHYSVEGLWSYSVADQTYTGTAVTPAVYLGSSAVEGEDYTVSCSNNINVGTATITVTGKGNYHGSVTKTFKIVPADISEKTISLSAKKYTYSGSAKKPSVTVEGLTKGTDYTVTYSNNTSVGTASVTVTGMGNYTGTITETFTIVPKAPASATAKLTGHDDVKFSWSKSAGASGYTVYYKRSTASSWTRLGRTTKTYYNKANLTDGVKYNFKVVPYYKDSDGNRHSSSAQYKTASVTTLKKSRIEQRVKERH